MEVVDTHAHLDFPDFDADREELIRELEQAGIGVINISTDEASINRVDELSRDNPLIWGAIGLHPTEVADNPLVAMPKILEKWEQIIAANSKIVAIGEIGLDYYHHGSNKTIPHQKAALRQFLTFAQEHQLPVVFHCREAYGDLLTMLRDYEDIKGVIHCFSGTVEQAEGFLELGFYLSATAMVTYPKNEHLAAIFKDIPEDRLMLETDCPYLPPNSKRGKRNDPRSVWEIAEFLAELRGVSKEKIVRQTTTNALRLFRLEE